MLRSRIIPVLLINEGYIVKTINFSDPRYIGEPINIVKIFNDKHADEITIFDIGPFKNREINIKQIQNIVHSARMPLCYGGGIKTVETAEQLLSIGIEKISLSSAFFENPKIIYDLSHKFGSQSVAVTFDINISDGGKYKLHNNYLCLNELNIEEQIKKALDLGCGELIINCVHKDGTENGYDEKLIKTIYPKVNIPLTFVGGASSFKEIDYFSDKYPMLGLGAGSIFIYKGSKKAVLISYPSRF